MTISAEELPIRWKLPVKTRTEDPEHGLVFDFLADDPGAAQKVMTGHDNGLITIALSEAGASKYQSASENKRRERKTERKEARGETAQQEHEGKSHLGARGKRESSRAMGGKNARRTTKRGRKAARSA